MKKLLLLISFVLVGCTGADKSSNNVEQLNQLIEKIWQYQISQSPILATQLGNHQWDTELSDLSPEALQKQNQQYQAFQTELKQLKQDGWSVQDTINYRLMKRKVDAAVNNYRLNKHYMPLTSESGFHTGLAFLPSSVTFKTVQDYQNYLARLSKFESYFDQQISWMKKGMETGLTQPQVVLKGFEESISAYIADDYQQSVFFGPLKRFPKSIDEQQQQQLIAKAKDVLEQVVFPSYAKFYDFMVNDYIPNARTDIAIASVEQGREYYDNEVAYYTTLDIEPEKIHEIGLQEVARIRAEMEEIIKEVNFEGSFADFVAFLRTDPQFYAKTPEELIKQASYISKQMDAKLPSLFKTLPRNPYGVAPVPAEIAPKYTTGRYVGPSREGQPGYYWVNTYALDRRPLYVLEALTFHEAVPGHHLQNALARELENVPEFRRRMYLSAFGEGWGLYSEYLGVEAGFYKDPYSRFGRLTYEMWRACRLVVDTGMHVMGWPRDKAMDYLASNTALSLHNVKTEIDRYISWPGQALSYKMGEITIKNLRAKAERDLGEKFDIRLFHDAILANGAVPLDQLEQQIEDFIVEQRGAE